MGDVHQRVVDADAAAYCAGQYRVAHGAILPKPVQGQRPGPGIDVVDGLINRVVRHHRQHRAKDFFMHQLGVRRHVKHNDWGHLTVRCGRAARVNGLQPCTARFGCCQHGLQPLLVARTDDGGVVGVASNGGEKLHHRLGVSMAKSGLLALRQQHVIRRNAGLPSIKQFAVRDFQSCAGHVAACINDARRLAAQFKRGRR